MLKQCKTIFFSTLAAIHNNDIGDIIGEDMSFQNDVTKLYPQFVQTP